MKKVKYTRLVILGILIYLVFNILVMIISKNVDTLVLKNEKVDAKIHVKGTIEKMPMTRVIIYLHTSVKKILITLKKIKM